MIIPATPPGATLPPEARQRIAAAAQQFESLALTELLTPIFNTVDGSKGPFGGGDGEAQWKPMLVGELAKHIASHGGIGLARPVMDQMLRIQESAK